MGKHHILTGLGAAGILVGLVLYGQPDSWTRSWALITLQAGAIFFAAGLAAWAIVDVLRDRQSGSRGSG